MITQLTIQGFKSFGMNSQSLKLGRLNFIVGANGSGKSNFLAAFRFLRTALLEGLDTAADDKEIRNLRLREKGKPKPVIFEFSFKPDQVLEKEFGPKIQFINYRIEADFRTEEASPIVLKEYLKAVYSAIGNEREIFEAERDKSGFRIKNPFATNGSRETNHPIGLLEQGKLIGASTFLGEPMAVLRRYVEAWASYSINAEVARRPCEASQLAGMGGDGERLGAILREIQRNHETDVLEAIESGVRSFIPGFQGVEPVEVPFGRSKWGFKVKEAGLSRAISPSAISDGTIRLITMIVIAEWCSRKSTLTTIEEPENSLHPALTESMVALFRSAAERSQFLISTHHAGFLDFLSPDELLLCTRDSEGNTLIRHASDHEDVEAFRKEYSLGEMWQMGLFGDA